MINLTTITNLIDKAMDSMKVPAETLPGTLINAIAIQRPGLSASKIASRIISNNNAIGIPTGQNPDGSPNLVNEYTYSVVKTVVEAIKEDAVVHVSIPPGTIMVQTEGGNAGGPVVSVGHNIITTTAKGIIR